MKISGVGVSPGIAIGKAMVLLRSAERVVRVEIPPERTEAEVARFERAVERSRRQLQAIKARIARAAGADHAYLFDAQLLMLDDQVLIGRAIELVRTEHVNAEWALERVFTDLAAIFDEVEDLYLRERKGDVADIAGRIQLNLAGGRADLLRGTPGPYILVASELTPSAAAQVDWTQVAGFITDAGSRTYHTAILARSLHVPAVVGLHDVSARVRLGTTVIVDANADEVLIDPDEALLAEYRARQARYALFEQSLRETRTLPAVTLDGRTITLLANLELAEEAGVALDHGAEGVGLYRSEFLLTRRPDRLPDEEEQFEVYRTLVARLAPRPVTIRTFDVDESQLLLQGGLDALEGPRPRLGLRGLRLALARRDWFRGQLRALLRASRFGNLRIMFPFVTGLEELREAKRALTEVRAELNRRGEAIEPVPVGATIEVPGAAFTADLLAAECDFLSIGTNDLIQYCLAVDRVEDKVAYLYQPLHPAILRLVRHILAAGRRRGIPVAVCGEMASDPLVMTVLLGLGLAEFSVNAPAIPLLKRIIREVRAADARGLARQVLRLRTVKEIEECVRHRLAGSAPAAAETIAASTARRE